MYKTIASRLSARFQVDGSHLQRYLGRISFIKKVILEELVLHDRIMIPTPDFLTADGLILILGERGMIELLESERVQFVRTRSVLGFVRGKGKDGGLAVFGDPDNKKPQDANLDESIEAGLSVIDGNLKEKKILANLRGGSGSLDSFCQFISGAWRMADYAAVRRVVRLSKYTPSGVWPSSA